MSSPSSDPSAGAPPPGRAAAAAPVLAGVTALTCLLGWLQKRPCATAGFDFVKTTTHGCYTDIYPLYYARGLDKGKVPYFDAIDGGDIHHVEYPVLSGYLMQLVTWLAHPFDPATRGMAFYHLTVVLLALLAITTVLATAYAAGRRSLRTGLMIALSPSLLLTAYINWDLLAVGLSALALAAWSRRRPALAGVLLGLAIAAKFYPLLFLGPLFLLCARAGQWRAFGRLLAGTAGAWLAVNVPVMVFAWDGWLEFYTFSQKRGVDWGSIFFVLQDHGVTATSDVSRLNLYGTGTFVLLAASIAVLAWTAPRRPRLPQLMFLVLVAFMLPNKVWSPQYVLWLLPPAVLARPKLPAFLVWQAGELLYFFGIWWYLLSVTEQAEGAGLGATVSAVLGLHAPEHGIDHDVYSLALLARFGTVLLLALLVIWEILRPSADAVRRDPGADDPAGGVLDGAPDRFALRRGPRAEAAVPVAG
ncbi:glycosyltransferase family 87 protein [Actinomadura parmotrematis]|uniref:Glycosyltransferase 87 family protein n=1 Tax=Actinomadura parmotrematis TaxID=2864039 RepID=A0ABS7G598_9ACTN|nr:glycosyltransferase 87 family protein [Actinomadura parmotrematis]MBW8487044.1 glycosyltransferase 87 family protein [Actinomadura parmotrematis]